MTNYQIFVTPLKSLGVYGAEVEISDWLLNDNIGDLTRGLDLTDYDLGIYAYNDVTLVFDASDGYLGDPTDSRSLFQFSRNLAKIRLVFLKDGVPLTTFKGLINESGTTIDVDQMQISLVIMGYDSVLKTALVGAGVVANGATFKQAFIAILNSAVSGILSINSSNINPVYNGTIDNGTPFDNLTAKDALDKLLLPANSILTVDSSGNVYIKARSSSLNPTLYLYGPGDSEERENITQIANYNNGQQRLFNVIQVTGGQPTVVDSTGQTVTTPALVGVAQDGTSVQYYGAFLKQLTVDFITQQSTLNAIAAALLLEFRYPKPEMEVTVATELVQAQSPATDLLDLVSINYPLLVRPLPNSRLPYIGITSIGDTTAPLPYVQGAIAIDPNVAWKVIQITEKPKDFTTTLKLRVNGQGLNDGFF